MRRIAMTAAGIAILALTASAHAQGTVRGAQRGADDGARAAGPVGAVVGGAVGAATGTVGGVLGTDTDARRDRVERRETTTVRKSRAH